MKLKKYFTVFLSAALGATMLVGCSPKADDKTQNNQTTTTKEISVVSPDGLPAISIAKMAKEKPVIKDGYNTTYEVINTTEALSTTVMKQEPDIAIVPSNMAALAYNKTSNYQIAGTTGMGSFYLVSTEDIKDFSDLVGKEVGNIGKGLTPDITVQSILKQKGINPEDINFTYVNAATDIVPLLATGKISTGFVPEPALTALMAKNPNLKISINLNDAWKETFNAPEGYPQATVIVKKELIDNDKEYVKEFLNNLSDSITWANENTTTAGQYANEIGVTTDATVISKSLARANLKYIPIKDMVKDYNDYYQKLFDFNAQTVGGKLPDEGIYYKGE